MPPKSLTKATTLQFLKDKLQLSHIEDLFFFTVSQWQKSSEKIVLQIQENFSPHLIIVRSSAQSEDSGESSMAGFFVSIANVNVCVEEKIKEAVEKVIASYEEGGHFDLQNQVLVQKQTVQVKMSGVIFTRQIETNAPYYIINYDDSSNKTDTVTSGQVGKTVAISHFTQSVSETKWHPIIESVKEIETLFPNVALDIEFALTTNDEVVIFQVRPLAANQGVKEVDLERAQQLLLDMKAKYLRFSKRVPHLYGTKVVFTDMTDWNPAEIIGDRPNTLDYTLYRFIITNNSWHEARTSLGYYDVFPGELMTSFAKKPYIDVRLSFNSLLPATLPEKIKEKLVNYYLEKLCSNPELQDKVEFEILWTCYDFSLPEKIQVLREHGFSQDEIYSITSHLKNLTSKIILNFESLFEEDLEDIRQLNLRHQAIMDSLSEDSSVWELFESVFYMLQNCKKYGTYPFSRMARIAFIAKNHLISMKENNTLSEEQYSELLVNIETVATKFVDDVRLYSLGEMEEKDFFAQYGHLRAGSYDITSPRYDQLKSLIDCESTGASPSIKKKNIEELFDQETKNRIEKTLKEHDLPISTSDYLRFIIKSIECRESFKFEFTKSLSRAIELIAQAGNKLGFSRNEICHADFSTLMSFRNPEISDWDYAKSRILGSLKRHQSEQDWYKKVIVPPVIQEERDFEYVEFLPSRPNFITTKVVQGEVIEVKMSEVPDKNEMERKIILIENADPGYDWVFSKSPLAIVTKYGGVASHMAIRCAEFGIPGAIGCGILYDRLREAKIIELNCSQKIIKPLENIKIGVS